MAKGLTLRQKEVLEFIRGFIREHGYPPTVRDIGKHFGLQPRAVFDHLRALERKGYIERRSSGARALVLKDHQEPPREEFIEVPILGRVAAGGPLLASENVEGTFPLPSDWVKGEAFLLRVKGESMIGAHILDGDYALVRRQPSAENGDIVVALIGEEATVKRLYREGEHVLLKPENPSMEPLVLREGDEGLQVLGKVIGVFRRL
ncbi:MAG: repressor LexA [candidate division NC10 bacterium]|nr:repressor LexA [candidate division NC10 bacterium]